MSETRRVIAPRGVINPDGAVHGTVTEVIEANGRKLAGVLVDFDPLDRVTKNPLPRHTEHPIYVAEEHLEPFTYEPNLSVTHDAGFKSPEESALALLDWLRDEMDPDRTIAGVIHVDVACEDGLTYQVKVEVPPNGTMTATLDGTRKGGIS